MVRFEWNFKTEKRKNRNKKRHIIKTVTWGIIGTLDTLILAWIFTGDALTGVKIITAELITKMVLYYLHEKPGMHLIEIVKLKKN